MRRAPPWALASGAAALVALVIVIVAVSGGDDGSLATADPDTTDAGGAPTVGGAATSIAVTAPRPGIVENTSTTAVSTTTTGPPTTVDLGTEYDPPEVDSTAIVPRSIPPKQPGTPPTPPDEPPSWAASRRGTPGGLATDVGCAANVNGDGLDSFFAGRVGPVLGWDYQHVVPLGGGRHLWLFQDTFVDHTGAATRLDQASFVHNSAMVQDGRCFTLLHQGTAEAPDEFEPGDGEGDTLKKWFWPMGGDSDGTTVWVFWAEMIKDPVDPTPPDGLGWHPTRTWLATYDAATLARTDFQPAPNDGAAPIYGYAVDSDNSWTYLFGNTFEQNLSREGGFWNVPHSGSKMWLARVPRFDFGAQPEYRTADGWSSRADDAVPIVDRFNIENPMQPRLIDGQWVSATAVDGYWGDKFLIDVADHPWGPWYPVDLAPLVPRRADTAMNSYHAHVLPWRDGFGSVQIAVSNNARDMTRDAFPYPWRYRPVVFNRPFVATPVPPPPGTTIVPGTTTTTLVPTTTAPPPGSTTTTTTVPATSTTTTVAPPTSTTTVVPTTTPPPTTTTTTVPPTTVPPPTSTTTTTTTTTVPPTTAPPTTAPADGLEPGP